MTVASALALVAVVVFGIVLPAVHKTDAPPAGGAPDPAREAAYRAVYQRDAAAVHADSAPFLHSASAPGVCNKGGTRQSCASTGEKVLVDLRKLQSELKPLVVPARYTQADSLLKQGVQAEMEGLALRDQAMTSTDPTASATAGNSRLAQAAGLLARADKAFPADARPVPSLAF